MKFLSPEKINPPQLGLNARALDPQESKLLRENQVQYSSIKTIRQFIKTTEEYPLRMKAVFYQ